MKRKNIAIEHKLATIRQSKPREMMPRPAVFRDKSKYNRNSAKASFRRELAD